VPWKFIELVNPTRIYVGAKGSALFLSFGFSIIYSRLLGLENRSVLTFIFTGSSLLILGFISSLGLTLRKSMSKSDNINLDAQQYIRNLLFLTLLLSGIYTSILIFYSNFVTALNAKLFGLSLVLFCASSIIQGFNELLIGLDRLRTIGLLENLEIFAQVILFIILYGAFKLSIIVSVILSITLAYILSTVVIWKLTAKQINLKLSHLFRKNPNYTGELKIFDSHSLTTTLPLVLFDRLDKVIIGIVLPLASLSKYAVLLVFFSLVRFIPESVSKTFFSKNRKKFHYDLEKLSLSAVITLLILLASYPLYSFSTKLILGIDWVLPLNIFVATVAFEFVRAIYLLRINLRFSNDLAGIFSLIHVWWFIGFSCLFILISTHFMGLIGAPLSMLLTYGCIIMYGEIVEKRSESKK
jgi:O-antigen/teichoic acid export membrane protein